MDAPDRVLRIWAMLSNADGELHQASLRPEMTARLQRQLDALTAELERSLSPALASELHRIIDRDEDTELTADELRVEYATLLAWTIGLVIEILSQLEAARREDPPAWPPAATGSKPVTDRGYLRRTRTPSTAEEAAMFSCADVEKLRSVRAPEPTVLSLYLPVPLDPAGIRGLAAEAADLMAAT